MNKQPQPIRLTLRVLLLPFVLSVLQLALMLSAGTNPNYWSIFPSTMKLVTQAIHLGIAVWLGFRLTNTKASTWFVPILLYAIATGTGFQIIYLFWVFLSSPSNRFPIDALVVATSKGIWYAIHTSTIQFLCCYLLSRGTGLLLQPVSRENEILATEHTNRLSILYYSPMIQKSMPASQLPTWWYFAAMDGGQFVFNFLIVGLLYWHGYRFVVASRNAVPSLEPASPFDSIGAES